MLDFYSFIKKKIKITPPPPHTHTQLANSGGPAQIEEFTELASYNEKKNYLLNILKEKKIIKYVKMAAFSANWGSSRTKVEKNDFFSVTFIFYCLNLNCLEAQ